MTQFRQVAETAAKTVGIFLRQNLGHIAWNQIRQKAPFDFVTHIDHEAEKMLSDALLAAFPDHRIYAEESTRQPSGGYRWIIDPLDGTTNYLHGHPVFSISLALEWQGTIILGVVFDPTREEMFVAQKGDGATLNGRPIQVSSISQPDRALLATGFPFRRKDLLAPYLRCFEELFTQVSGVRRMGSAALDLCYVACGRVDGFWEIGLSPWDVAAGYLIVEEAGGVVTDFAGGDQAIWSGNVIASNGLIQELMQNSIQTHLLPAMRGKNI